MKQQMMGWQLHQLEHMQIICISLQTDTPAPLITTGRMLLLDTQPTVSVKPLKALLKHYCADRIDNI